MKGTREALLVAASDYHDPALQQLRWPAADVASLATVLGPGGIGHFEVDSPVINEPSHIVKRRIEKFLAGARRDDDVRLLYFSCHGVLSEDRRLYFAMPDTETDSIMSTAVDDVFVHSALQKARGAKILILDCCHSGAYARDLATKGPDEREIQVERFTGGGLVTLTASKEIEYAYEHGEFTELEAASGGSIFTRIMIEGLRTGAADMNEDGTISVDELYEWTVDRMQRETTRQQPGHSSFRRHGKVAIGFLRRARLPEEVRARIADDASVHGQLWAIEEMRAYGDDADPELAAEIREALTTLVGSADPYVAASAEAALLGRPAPRIGVASRDAPPPPSERAAALMDVALEHRVTGRNKAALRKYDEALGLSPDATDARVGRARALRGLKRLDEALETLDAAVDDDPTHVPARVWRADVLLALDRPAAAQLDVASALEAEPDSTDALTMQGHVHAALGHEQNAVTAYEQALEHEPEHLDALVGLGRALAAEGVHARALSTLDRALEIDNNNVDALIARSRLHYADGVLSGGDADVARVLELEPANVPARVARGMAHLNAGGVRSRDPVHDFDAALAVDPRVAGALYGRSLSMRESRPEEALAAVQRIDLSHSDDGAWRPATAAVRELEAELLLDLGRPEPAVAAVDAGLVDAPESSALRLLRARANIARGRPELALGDLEHTSGSDPAATDALRTLALGSLMSRPREVWPDGIREEDVASVLHGDTLLSAQLPGLSVDPMSLARRLRPGEELIWYTACRYRQELLRRVALLLTSEQLVWTGREDGAVDWRDVREVRELPPKGMRLVLYSGRRLEFPGIADQGVSFGSASADQGDAFDAHGVRRLAARLAAAAAPESSQ